MLSYENLVFNAAELSQKLIKMFTFFSRSVFFKGGSSFLWKVNDVVDMKTLGEGAKHQFSSFTFFCTTSGKYKKLEKGLSF